ncbi:hypothetical protein [Pararhodobacter aggregans]|nr:hypothetical protein [Pararhodobacter aggregans]
MSDCLRLLIGFDGVAADHGGRLTPLPFCGVRAIGPHQDGTTQNLG